MSRIPDRKIIPVVATLLLSSFVYGLTLMIPRMGEWLRPPDRTAAGLVQDTVRKQEPAKDSLFRIAMASADLSEKSGDFSGAIAFLENALKIKPGHPGVNERITRLKKQVSGQAGAMEESKKAMASGDQYFSKKDYLNAKAAYQLAIDEYPGNTAAKEKLQKTMELLRSQKAQNILFDVAIAAADKLFQAGDYEKARTEYENAGKLLPGDPYPKNRINEIIKILVDQKVRDDEYAKAVASADKSFATNNLQLALLDFKKASGIKPAEKYPQQKIREINDILAKQKQIDDAYNQAVAAGDQHFKVRKYQDAIKSYQQALVVKPEQVYPQSRIMEIESLLARITKEKEDYEQYITLADSLYIEKQYLKAREQYLLASSVKPNENYPREMVSKADKMLSGQEEAIALALLARYNRIVLQADSLMAANELEPARAEYSKASNLKPGESYPKEQIRAIDDALAAALRNKDEAYQKAISAGEKALSNRIFELALSEFKMAQILKPDETYPKEKITETEKLIALDAARKAEDARYTAAIAGGDSLFVLRQYQTAKQKFTDALAIKPREVYPRNRIAEIDAMLAEAERLIKTDKQYHDLIAKADNSFQAGQYQEARSGFASAKALKPDEIYPKEKIAEIDRILTDLEAAKAMDNQYRSTIALADKQFIAKTYDVARTSYESALKLKPSETYPAGRIEEIDRILAGIEVARLADENYRKAVELADRLFSDSAYMESRDEYARALTIKPQERYPVTRMAEIETILADRARRDAQEKEYAGLVADGNRRMDEKAYNEAKEKYLAALKLKPQENYPAGRIAEADSALAELARLNLLEEQYQASVTKADALFNEKNYEGARSEYRIAAGFKPAEKYPAGQIDKIDRILSDMAEADRILTEKYQAALNRADQLLSEKSYDKSVREYEKASEYKPAEDYPKQQIEEIRKILTDIAKQKEIDDEFSTLMAEGERLFAEKSYEPARTKFNGALELKPGASQPLSRIGEIDRALAEEARLRDLESQYQAAISLADQTFLSGDYAAARDSYLKAGTIKPSETYPSAKIKEIDDLLAEQERMRTLEENYNKVIADADQQFASSNLEGARSGYTAALALKPNEAYPTGKIAEIDKVLAELRAREEAFKGFIKRGDQLFAEKKYEESRNEYTGALDIRPGDSYAKDRIAEITRIQEELLGKQKYYENLVAEADQLFNDKKFVKSKENYQRATDLFPDQAWPKERIRVITAKLDSIYRVAKANYDLSVRNGDISYRNRDYTSALEAYAEAAGYLPSEPYPAEMIAKIRKRIIDNKVVDILTSAVTIKDNQEKRFDFTPIAFGSRSDAYFYIKLRNLSDKPISVMVRYGRDGAQNGGVIMRNISFRGKDSERMVIVYDQDPWIRNDNNWVGLVPQGGDIEVSLIQIARDPKD